MPASTKTSTKNSPKASAQTNHKSITAKIAELNQQTDWFYGDDFSLDQASQKYQTAVQLAKEIEQDLNNLKNEIEIIGQDFSKD